MATVEPIVEALRVHFAGDYAHDPAIGGAAWSGDRAASAVLDAIGE